MKNPVTSGVYSADGMTLLEMLAYTAALAVMVNICAVAFVQGNRVAQVGEAALARMDTAAEIERDFSTAVRGAVAIESEMAGFLSDTSAVVLRLPSDEGNAGSVRFVVFGARAGEPLHRTDYVMTNGSLSLERHKNYPVPYEIVEFGYDRVPVDKARTVTIRLGLFRDRLDNRTGGGLTCTASLRALEAQHVFL